VVRVTDVKVLDAPMERVTDIRTPGGVSGNGSIFAIDNHADTALAALRYRMKDAAIDIAEEGFEAGGRKFARGSFLIRSVSSSDLQKAASDLGLQAYALATAPAVKTHPARAARVALLHTWLSTQGEGWWREAFDAAGLPYDYISTQAVAAAGNLNTKYDVILFPPGAGGDPLTIVKGMPTDWGNPLPWKITPETPNMGIDSSDDIRPGLGWSGLAHLQDFVRRGGVLVTVADTANFATSLGLTRGVSVAPAREMKIIGSVVRTQMVDAASPIAYGYGEKLSVYCFNGPIFNLSNFAAGRGGGRRPRSEERERPTGRGSPDDPDFTPGRPAAEAPEEPHAEAWEALPLTEEQRRNNVNVLPPTLRPRVILRYADAKDLLVSGLVEDGNEIAEHAAVIDVPMDKGHVVLFSPNPVYRGETEGTYSLVLNTILNFDSLDTGRKLDKDE